MLLFAQDVTYRVHITLHQIISFLIALVKDTHLYNYTCNHARASARTHTHTRTHIHTHTQTHKHKHIYIAMLQKKAINF